jgi:hypothetical protein
VRKLWHSSSQCFPHQKHCLVLHHSSVPEPLVTWAVTATLHSIFMQLCAWMTRRYWGAQCRDLVQGDGLCPLSWFHPTLGHLPNNISANMSPL